MNPLARAAMAGAIGELTIGSADLDARAQGVTLCGRGGPIRAFQVIGGSGNLVYVDDRTGATCTLTGLSSTSGDVEPEGGLSIRSINGTSNASPSGALTLRCLW